MGKKVKPESAKLGVAYSDDKQPKASAASNGNDKNEKTDPSPTKEIKNKVYEMELAKLQIELVKLQEWIKNSRLKVVVIF